MRGAWRLRRWCNHIGPRSLILLYHRVADAAQDPQLLCVTPQHFAEHLAVLRRCYHSVSLNDLRRRPLSNLWPPRRVAITFDDGYADNLYQVRPLLEAADVPATVFVVAGRVGSNRAFWWDELERILLTTPKLPERLRLKIGDRQYAWDLGKDEKDHHPGETWHVLMDTEHSPRQAVYKQLAELLRGLEESAREMLLEELSTWSGEERNEQSKPSALNAEELQWLARDGLIEIGAHTMSHPVLSALSPEAQLVEIAAGKERLEDILGRPVIGFSYPFGGRNDYTAETVSLVKETGFDYACSSFRGLVRWGTDPYQLPRLLVRDWDGEEFARRLEDWLGG